MLCLMYRYACGFALTGFVLGLAFQSGYVLAAGLLVCFVLASLD